MFDVKIWQNYPILFDHWVTLYNLYEVRTRTRLYNLYEVTLYKGERLDTLWLFNIAMENDPFIDGLPIKNGDFPWLC